MTREERIRAFTMRCDGYSLHDVAQAVGYTENTVRSDLLMVIHKGARIPSIIYPAIRDVVVYQYGGSLRALSAASGIPVGSLYTCLSGRSNPGKKFRKKLSDFLKIPEEVAFRV